MMIDSLSDIGWTQEKFLEFLPMAACVISRAGIILYGNQAFARLYQSPIEEMIGQPMAKFSEISASNVQNDFVTFDRGGDVPGHELCFKDMNYWVEVRPIRDEQGVAVALMAAKGEITAVKNAQQTRAQPNPTLVDEAHLIDPVTGLQGRQFFINLIQQYLQLMLQEHTPLSVILLEIDDFEEYGSAYGAKKADQLLKVISEKIAETLRSRPLKEVCRYGDQQFGILLPDTSIKEAYHIAEDIRKKIVVDLAMPHSRSEFKRVTVSLGAYTEVAVVSYMRILYGADNALFLAKKNGKDRVEIF
jgi:diguanylate cyclase (GGDEF)-like protein